MFTYHPAFSTCLCLSHSIHLPPATSQSRDDRTNNLMLSSRTIAFQAAGMITSIVDSLQTNDELRFAPAFV